MKVTDEMRAEIRLFRQVRVGLIGFGVPGPIADSLAKDAVEESRGRSPEIAGALCDPRRILEGMKAQTLMGAA